LTLILSKTEVRQRLVMEDMIDQMEAGFLAFAKGLVEMPQRVRLLASNGEGYGSFMPCQMRGQGFGIKINTNFPDNPVRHGLPRILGLLVLLDTTTGMPLAIMDSTAITAFRTAAVSGVAMRRLARKDVRVLGVLGTGVQCLPHLLAGATVRRLDRVRVYSPNLHARQDEFVRRAHETVNIPVVPARSAEEVVTEADILIVCTGSSEPVLDGRWIREGTCVIAVGNATPNTRELDSLTVIRSKVICDSWRACILESGDFLIPMREGVITDTHIREDLGDVLQAQTLMVNQENAIVLFKSVGLAFEDLIAARHVYANALAARAGIEFDFFGMPASSAAN